MAAGEWVRRGEGGEKAGRSNEAEAVEVSGAYERGIGTMQCCGGTSSSADEAWSGDDDERCVY
jgi:hypothetical protein